jgi:hypothetical protein
MQPGSDVLLDAYYASVKVLKPLRQTGSHLITRVRSSTVAYAAFCACPGKRRGRPRQWGSPIHLQALFAQKKTASKPRLSNKKLKRLNVAIANLND